MLLLDRQSAAASPHRGGTSRIQLRFRADGQLLELPLGKTTIGSSPRCSIRIQKPGVAPLHCLIVHEASGLTVRRWAGEALLNGQVFDESVLNAGDCLSVGPVEFEVVGAGSATSPVKPVAAQAQAPAPVAKPSGFSIKPPTSVAKPAPQIRPDATPPRTDKRESLATLRRGSTIPQASQQQVVALQEEIAQRKAELLSVSNKLAKTVAELTAVRLQLTDQKSLIAARQEVLQQNQGMNCEVRELSARVEALTGEAQTAANDRETLARKHADLLGKCERLATENSQLKQDTAELANQIAAVASERDALRGDCDTLRSECEGLRGQFEAVRGERAELQGDHEGLRVECDRMRSEIESLQAEAEALVAEKTTIATERAAARYECDELRRQMEQLRDETHSLAKEKSAIAQEQSALNGKRYELELQVEALETRIAELHEENSAMAVAKLAVLEERDTFFQQSEQLQTRVGELTDENADLVAAKLALSNEVSKLQSENQRLTELERDMRAAVVDRESTSEELYRALLQIAELQGRDEQNKELVTAYESLCDEHERLISETAQLNDQIASLSEERAAVEAAKQAIGDEAAVQSESHQHLEIENSALLANLADTQQRLDEAGQEQAELAAKVAELESELVAKQHVEASAREDQATLAANIAELERELAARQQEETESAQMIAEGERRIAAQAQEFAESINRLEHQLAEANSFKESFVQMRDQWQRDRAEADRSLAEAERQRDEQTRRITGLEELLAAAEDKATKLAERAAAAPTSNWGDAAQFAVEQPAAQVEQVTDSFESTASESQWDRASSAAEEWPAASHEAPANDSTANPWGQSSASQNYIADDGFGAAETGDVARQPIVWGSAPSNESTIGGEAFGDESAAAWNIEPKLKAQSTPHAGDDPAKSSAALEALRAPVVESTPGPAVEAASTNAQPSSFIERYSHMFTDDDAEAAPSPVVQPIKPQASEMSKPRTMGIIRSESGSPPAKSGEDEESIEQYMSKLLQRVRGDSPLQPASQSLPAAVPQQAVAPLEDRFVAAPMAPRTVSTMMSDWANELPASDDVQDTTAPQEAVKRKASAPTPTTNLGALRALANESARRAIGRHELRRLQRNAVTKVIVSTLAGVTSLWLMLDAPHWRDIQFITACVSLIVAAYWAGETFRTLLESLKAAAYDGPEADLDDTSDVGPAPLPIDVEDRN